MVKTLVYYEADQDRQYRVWSSGDHEWRFPINVDREEHEALLTDLLGGTNHE